MLTSQTISQLSLICTVDLGAFDLVGVDFGDDLSARFSISDNLNQVGFLVAYVVR